MKKTILLFATMMFLALGASAQSINDSYTRKGKSFTEAVVSDSTGYTWTEKDGTISPIHISSTGRCYIIKISKKTGNKYYKYLPVEVSKEICRELGRKFVEKDDKK